MRTRFIAPIVLVVGALSCSSPTEPAAVATVTITPNTMTLASGATTTLTAATLDAKGGALTGRVITWSSSNTSIATVNANGVVTAGMNQGGLPAPVSITATSEGKSASVAIEVTPLPVQRIVITQDSVMIRSGSSFQLHTTVYGQDGAELSDREIRWVTLDSSIARITSTGLVSIDAHDGARYRTTHVIAISGGASDSARIVAQPLAPTLQINITDTLVRVGTSTTVSWTSTRAHTCQMSGITVGNVAVTGQSVHSPTSGGRRFARVTCTGDGGTQSDSAKIITPNPVLPTSYENYREYVVPAVNSPHYAVPECTKSGAAPANARAYADFLQNGTLVMADYVGGSICFWERTGAGEWVDISNRLIPNPGPQICKGNETYPSGDANKGLVADYNGDRRPDIFFVCYTGESLWVLSNADGTYRTKGTGFNAKSHAASAGDIDSDGDIDVLLGNDQWEFRADPNGLDAYLTVLNNDGAGSFTRKDDQVNIPDSLMFATIPPVYPMQSFTVIELIDVDEDGVLDAIFANGQYPTTIFWGAAGRGVVN